MHIHCAAQLAFVFGAFLRQDVAFERLTAFNSTTWANAKTFFRAAFAFHFWHITTFWFDIVSVRRDAADLAKSQAVHIPLKAHSPLVMHSQREGAASLCFLCHPQTA